MVNEPNDPKALEYSQVLTNLTLMQARLDKLEEEAVILQDYCTRMFSAVASVARSVQVLQDYLLNREK